MVEQHSTMQLVKLEKALLLSKFKIEGGKVFVLVFIIVLT